jgi:uncharacterized protein with von Willebrand factor type A (vWA) domain/WD40 repeat protein
MNEIEHLPLWNLFHKLRKAGLPLEIDDYKLALQALQCGLGIEDKEALARLCRTLWVKSREENLLFNYHFEQVINTWNPPVPIEETGENRNQYSILKSKGFWAIGTCFILSIIGGSLVSIIGGSPGSKSSDTKQCPYFTSTPSPSVMEGQTYSYTPVACKANETDPPLKIQVLNLSNKPSWLQVRSYPNGTVKIEGKAPESFVWHPMIRRWDITTGKLQDTFIAQAPNFPESKNHSDFPKISPNGKYVAIKQDDRTINIWQISGEKIATSLHSDRIIQVVFSPNSEFLATVVEDEPVQVWDLRKPQQKPRQLPHTGRLSGIQFSSDGKHLATFTTDKSVYLWNYLSGQKKKSQFKLSFDRINFTPNGQLLITSLPERTRDKWSIQESLHISQWDPNRDPPAEISNEITISSVINGDESISPELSPNGKYVATQQNDSNFEIRNILEKKSVLLSDVGIVKKADFSPNSEFLAIIQPDGLVRIWDLKGEIQQNRSYLLPTQEKISRIKFSSDGKHLAALTDSKTENSPLYNTEDSKVYLSDVSGQHPIPLSESQVVDMDFSPNGKLLITRSKDNIVKLWDVKGQGDKPRLTLDGTNYSVMFSDDGQSLISTSMIDYSTIKLQLKDAAGNVKDTQSFNLQIRQDYWAYLWETMINQKIPLGIFIFGISLFLLAIAYPIARSWLIRNAKFSTEEEPSIEPIEAASPQLGLESKPEPEDEIQVGKAIRGSRFETDEYFPITHREMKQSWRYLRRMVREGGATELDLEETVRQISQQGLMLNLVLRPPRVNRAELLLLIDREGSMVPFHVLSRRLEETALQGGRLAKVGVYHFHNCPDNHLYNDPSRTEAMPIEAVLNAYSGVTGVLICSDAGAANGGFNPERVQLTEEFLERIKQRFRYVAWLNPMPIDRWERTSAESIARSVPMFEFSRQGLHQAIAILQGKLVPLSIKD